MKLADISELVVAPSVWGAVVLASVGVGGVVLSTALLVVVSGKMDRSGGVLTISILIAVSFMGAVGYCLFFTVPQDEVTPAVVGGLTAGFGAVCAHWLGRPHGINAPPEPPHMQPLPPDTP